MAHPSGKKDTITVVIITAMGWGKGIGNHYASAPHGFHKVSNITGQGA